MLISQPRMVALTNLASGGQLLHRDEGLSFHLPGEYVVLHDAHLGALDHPVRLSVLHEHTDDGGLGHKGMNAGHHFQIARRGEHMLLEAGAVVIVHTLNTLPDLRAAHCRRVHGQVAAFGMAADGHGQMIMLMEHFDILHRQALGGHRLLEAHVEILFPAHQGVVRPTEGGGQGAVIQQICQGGKLGILLRDEFAAEPGQPYPAEPMGGGSRLEQLQLVGIASWA